MDKLKTANADKKRLATTVEALHSQIASLQSSLSLRSSSGDDVVDRVREIESENAKLREEVLQQSNLIKDLDEDASRMALEGEKSANIIQVRRSSSSIRPFSVARFTPLSPLSSHPPR